MLTRCRRCLVWPSRSVVRPVFQIVFELVANGEFQLPDAHGQGMAWVLGNYH
jgi:hypothetical protein